MDIQIHELITLFNMVLALIAGGITVTIGLPIVQLAIILAIIFVISLIAIGVCMIFKARKERTNHEH